MKKFSFEHVVLSPKDQIGLHKQGSWELSYIVRGDGIRTIGDTKERFQAGEIVLVVPNMQHQWCFNTPTDSKDGMIENITITFSPALLSNLSSIFEEMEEMVLWYNELDESILLPKESNLTIKDIIWKMLHQDDCERLLSLLSLLVLIWKSDRKRQVGHFQIDRNTEIVNKVVTYLHCNFKRQITIKQIATYVGMNGTRLCSLFKRKKQTTIMQYLLDYRMMMVKESLRRDNTSISQVCYECGFRDVPYFNRTFKKFVGITPKEYKRITHTEAVQ
jgi:AraC-like DNA-binding protein